LLVGSLGNVACTRHLVALIGIALSGRLRIAVPLAVTRLPGISLLALRIILLRIRILVCTLIRDCRRLTRGIPGLLISSLASDGRLTSRYLWSLVNALGRLITGLLRLIARLLCLVRLLLGLIGLLLRLLISLLRRISLESSSPGIASGRVARL